MIFCGERCRACPATSGATGGLPASANGPGLDDNVDTDNDGDVTFADFGDFQLDFTALNRGKDSLE